MSKVLLVDDSISYRVRLRQGLEKDGLQIIEAENGREGLQILMEDKDINFIVCDLNMPVLNGFGMLREIQLRQVAPQIPVIILTTEGSPELKDEGRSLGVRAWISKLHTYQDAQQVSTAIQHLQTQHKDVS